MQQMISEIMKEMEQDIRCDIHGDIYGHERWAEEIFRLRAELRRAKEKAIEDSWRNSPDRMGGQFSDGEILDSYRNSW